MRDQVTELVVKGEMRLRQADTLAQGQFRRFVDRLKARAGGNL